MDEQTKSDLIRMSGDYDEKFNAEEEEVMLNLTQTESLLNEMQKLIKEE